MTKEHIVLAKCICDAKTIADLIPIVGSSDFSIQKYPWVVSDSPETLLSHICDTSAIHKWLRTIPEEILFEALL